MSLRLSIIERLADLNGDARAAARLANPPIDDLVLNPGASGRQHPTPAAVLVPLVERAEGMTVLLTLRTDHLNDHAGQVSFPGGRVEPGDADLLDTALRETEEEIGIERSFVEVIGTLDPYETMTGFRITPVVAFVRPGFALELDEFEVAEAFEIPLPLALDSAKYARRARVHLGERRQFYVLEHDRHFIWGATAGILFNLCRRLEGLLG
ncbi:MAG TPA: CoA pyrophosphatase [Gammaproteobacteria bacterium]